MNRYIIRRVALYVPTLFLVSLIVFLLLRLVPGDIIDATVTDDRSLGEQQRNALRRELGLDRPAYMQFLVWLGGVMHGDFQTSFWTKQPVGHILAERFPRSLELTIITVIFAITFGVLTGIISAIRQDTWIDYALRVVVLAGISLPVFFTAILLMFVLIILFDWLPPLSYSDFLEDPVNNLKQLAIPSLILGYSAAAPISRMTRSQLLEVLRQDYIRTAWAKGLHGRVVVYRHALRNALLPIITLAGALTGGLLGGVVIIEFIFAIPGIGTSLIDGIRQRDYPLVQAVIFMMALIYLTINLLVDLSYGWIDPRIRYG